MSQENAQSTNGSVCSMRPGKSTSGKEVLSTGFRTTSCILLRLNSVMVHPTVLAARS